MVHQGSTEAQTEKDSKTWNTTQVQDNMGVIIESRIQSAMRSLDCSTPLDSTISKSGNKGILLERERMKEQLKNYLGNKPNNA